MSTNPPPKPGGIDWQGRVEELEGFSEAKLGVSSRDIDLIAMSLLPTRSHEPIWMIYDGQKHEFWHLLDRVTQKITGDGVHWITSLRTLRPRYANPQLLEIMEDRNRRRLFYDNQFAQSYNHFTHPRSQYTEVEGECLRASVEVNWMIQPDRHSEAEFEARLRKVLAPEHRVILPVGLENPNATLLSAIRMALIGNPSLNPSSALRNGCMLLSTHAIMRGRERLEEADHWVLYRVLRDSFCPWNLKILSALAESDGYMKCADLQRLTGLNRETISLECARMADNPDPKMAVVEWPKLRTSSGPGGGRAKYVKLQENNGIGQDMRAFLRAEMRWW